MTQRPDIDWIGVLWSRPAIPPGWTYGDPKPMPKAIAGWHVNATPAVLEARPDLASFVVTPTLLRQVWAGDNPYTPALTVALWFSNEVAAREALGELAPTGEIPVTAPNLPPSA